MGPYLARTLLWMGMLASFCNALPAREPGNTAAIMIEVKDQSGAIAPNARVQILPFPNTNGKDLTTDSDGKLSLNVPPGNYDLRVTLPGFLTYTKRIEVQNDSHQIIDVVLKVGDCPPGPCGIVSNVFPVSFPDQSQAASPDGRYVIVGVDGDADPHHTVFLEDRILKTRRKLFNYDRHVVFLWYYDSNLFAVTDYVSSDSSRCSIISVDEKVPPIQVLDLLFRQLSESSRERLKSHLSNHHAYVEASVWAKPTDLELKVSGFGDTDPAGFTEFYSLQVHHVAP